MRYWINELWRLGYMLFGLGAIGLLLGELGGELFAGLGWGLAAGLGLYVFLHLRHVRMLYVWLLKNPREAPPPGTGVGGDLFDRLYNYQKAQTQLQQRLRDILLTRRHDDDHAVDCIMAGQGLMRVGQHGFACDDAILLWHVTANAVALAGGDDQRDGLQGKGHRRRIAAPAQIRKGERHSACRRSPFPLKAARFLGTL